MHFLCPNKLVKIRHSVNKIRYNLSVFLKDKIYLYVCNNYGSHCQTFGLGFFDLEAIISVLALLKAKISVRSLSVSVFRSRSQHHISR